MRYGLLFPGFSCLFLSLYSLLRLLHQYILFPVIQIPLPILIHFIFLKTNLRPSAGLHTIYKTM